MQNDKNRVLEMFQRSGTTPGPDLFSTTRDIDGVWHCKMDAPLPDGRRLVGKGSGARKTHAEIAAATQALGALEQDPAPEEQLWRDAQCGDVLIKLARYLTAPMTSREENSARLQLYESDGALDRVFEQWKASGADDVVDLPDARGQKYRATAVEALLWRRFADRVLAPNASVALSELVAVLDSSTA